MKSEKTGKKSRKRDNAENEDRKGRDKGTKVQKSIKMKRKLDWRDLLMEEEDDYSLPDR